MLPGMTLGRWTRLSSELLFENPWWRYRREQFEIAPGKRGEYHVASTYGSAMVVPVGADGRLLLLEQYRYLADRNSLEFPCGGLAKGERPEAAAARELAEESGYAGTLVPLGTFNPWNGVTDETCHVFVARDLVASTAGAVPDDTESFVVHRIDRAELASRIAAGAIWDGMTLAAYALFCTREPG
jgi:8-oxo-dGTP pyrophosphatase MutT (NUDIX family)